jgi:hypothetical protein
VRGISLEHIQRRISPKVGRMKPDAVAQNSEDTTVYLLEFARTTDFWGDSLEASRLRKHCKVGYVEMIAEFQLAFPGWTVQLLTFVQGDRGMFLEEEWTKNLELLGVDKAHHGGIFTAAVQSAYDVHDDILAAKRGALQALVG